MPAFITVGRVLFSVLFIVSGAFKLFDIAGTAEGIASKVVIPTVLASFTAQLEGLTGFPTAQMLAIAVGALH
jgi:putative oxidoreductase